MEFSSWLGLVPELGLTDGQICWGRALSGATVGITA